MNELLSTREIAQRLSVNITTVISWIDQGKLKAHRTPGGHRRVRRDDFLTFAKAYDFPLSAENEKGPIALIVEDDKDFRAMIRNFIGAVRPDVTVQEAADGFEAGQKVSEIGPDILILDLFLPGVNGFEICERIRSHPDLRETAILAMSGKSTEAEKERILRAGADAFLSKPFDVETFARAFNTLLPEAKTASVTP
jgi:excisionase family DNA binding protein